MKIKTNVKFLQDGGAVTAPAPEQAPTPQGNAGAGQGGGEDPIVVLAQMASQALQTGNGEMALQVCEGFLQLVQQMMGSPEGAGTPPPPQGEPVYKKGGKLAYRK